MLKLEYYMEPTYRLDEASAIYMEQKIKLDY